MSLQQSPVKAELDSPQGDTDTQLALSCYTLLICSVEEGIQHFKASDWCLSKYIITHTHVCIDVLALILQWGSLYQIMCHLGQLCYRTSGFQAFQNFSNSVRKLKKTFNKIQILINVYLLSKIAKITCINFYSLSKEHVNKVCMKPQANHVQIYLFQLKFKQNPLRNLGIL